MGEQSSSPPPAEHPPLAEDVAAESGGHLLNAGPPAGSAEPVAGDSTQAGRLPAGAPSSGGIHSAAGAEPAVAPPFLSRGDQVVVALLCLVTVVLLLIRQSQVMQWGRAPAALVHADGSTGGLVLDVNSASWVEWLQLEGIGETLARRIVAERETGGAFTSVDDLTRVRGIGPKTVERLRPWLRLGTDGPPSRSGESDSDRSDFPTRSD